MEGVIEEQTGFTRDGISENEWRSFIGGHADNFIYKWGKAKDPAKCFHWNLSSFFAGFLWMGYRKMYMELFILFLLLCPFVIISEIIQSPIVDRLIPIIIGVTLGLYGNTIYYNFAKRKIKLAKEKGNLDLSIIGGTSWKGVGVALLFFLGFVIITAGWVWRLGIE